MLPFGMRLKVRSRAGRRVSLWFPVILLWVVLRGLMLAVLPFMILAALPVWRDGPGWRLLLVYPLLFTLLWNLSGLHIEKRDARNDVLISFQ